MSDAGHVITHVSDTARWTARYRATESTRSDALFRDPLAERLAGQQGRMIVANSPTSSRSGWWLVARTKIIDDAIAEAIASGCDRVLRLPIFLWPAVWGPQRNSRRPGKRPWSATALLNRRG